MDQEEREGGACCEACAARPIAIPVASPIEVRSLPVVEMATSRVPVSRDMDRRITVAGVGVAAGFVALALLGLAHLVVGQSGPWIPLHLALAGAASTAVATVLPFFTAALAAARPADPRLRAGAIGAVAAGALVVSVSVPLGASAPAVTGGLVFVAGIAGVAIAAVQPLRSAVGVRRPVVEAAYLLALGQVAIGVLLAVAMVGGVAPIVERWAWLKPAHAWLNVFGFLSVVIAATLIHLAPTVAGNRIRPRRSGSVAIAGLVAGAPLVALGLALVADPIVRIGAAVSFVGASALVAHGLSVHRARAAWTTDHPWHRLTSWSLLASTVWLLVAVTIIAGRHLWLGADPAAWSIGLIAAPLAFGFVTQALVGAWSHLVPAIGPGDPAARARQRQLLGRWATPRLATLNGGAATVALGMAIGSSGPTLADGLVGGGLVLAAGSLAVSLALFATAMRTARQRLVVAMAS